MKKITGTAAQVISLIFQTLLITYLALLLAEQLWPGIITFYLHMNYILVLVILVGILSVFAESPPRAPEKTSLWFVALLALAGAALIKYKTASLGMLSWIIAFIAGILIFSLAILITNDTQESLP